VPGETNAEREIILPDDILTAVTVDEARALADLARGKTVLELGAYHGFSTVVLASVAELVVSVDWHQGDDMAGRGDTWGMFMSNLTRYGVEGYVKPIRQRFDVALPGLAKFDWQFDGCFLDAHHSEESVRADLALALPLIKPGGFMAFHDYGRNSATGNPGFGVTEAADDLVGIAGRVGFLGWGFVPDAA
jgi:predicted O-methyltransferase YrrM